MYFAFTSRSSGVYSFHSAEQLLYTQARSLLCQKMAHNISCSQFKKSWKMQTWWMIH